MRTPFALLSLATLASALPAQLAFQLPDAIRTGAAHLQSELKSGDYLSKLQGLGEDSWGLVKDVIDEGGKRFDTLQHPSLPEYTLRVTEPKLCDSSVKQYSGYLDVGEDKHLFFWFFESRNDPKNDPLVLWLNGGPGCSSSTGLLFELGPCSISKNETVGTINNPSSWTSKANVIFLDQPVNVGYSFSEGSTVSNSQAAAEDVFAFLTLFISQYTKYAKNDFHISGESYAGTYLPNIASVINRNTQALTGLGELAPLPKLNFKSVLIGNGLTDPKVQFGTGVYDYACKSPYAVFEQDGPECANLKAKGPSCAKLIDNCYKSGSRFACVPAALYCWTQMYGDFNKLGLNPYDVRKTCDKAPEKDGPLCYPQMGWVEEYLNRPDVKAELGVPASREFASCNMQINQAFMFQGDGMHNSAALIPDLLASGIRVLVYAGEADMMCNYVGNQQWMEALENPFQEEFNAAKLVPYVTLKGKKNKKVGSIKVAGPGAGNLTYISIEGAGHMVPFDQPEVALDLFDRWLANTPLIISKKDKKN